jgi:hypothetical protein
MAVLVIPMAQYLSAIGSGFKRLQFDLRGV